MGIPSQYVAGIEKLLDIDDSVMLSIVSILKTATPSLDIEDLASTVSSSVEQIDLSTALDILRTLRSFYSFKQYQEFSVEETIADIIKSLKESEEFSDLSEDSIERFRKRVFQFLKDDNALSIAAKAIDVMRQHERLFLRSRIFTDIRTVFASELNESPSGVAIFHMLKIAYEEEKEKKEFFIALEANDIEQILQQLERAVNKTKAIKTMLEKANISYLDME